MREAFFMQATMSLQDTNQDQFLLKSMEEIKEVSKKQIEQYRKTQGEANLIDSSLGDLV